MFSDVYKEFGKRKIDEYEHYLVIDIIANDLEEDEEQDLPYIRFRFR